MTHQQDLDNHANQLNPNNDAYWESRGYDDRPNDWKGGGGSSGDDDDYDGGAGGSSSPAEKEERERQEPKKRNVHIRCSVCGTDSDVLAEEDDTDPLRTWWRSLCPVCGNPIAIEGELAAGPAAATHADNLGATARDMTPATVASEAASTDLSLQNAVIGYLSQSGCDSLTLSMLYHALGVQSRSPAYTVEEFGAFLDGMVSRHLILSDKVYRVQRYV